MSLIRKYKYWILVVIVAGIVWAVKWNDDRVANERAVEMLEDMCVTKAQKSFVDQFILVCEAKGNKSCIGTDISFAETYSKYFESMSPHSEYGRIFSAYEIDLKNCNK